MTGVGIAVEHGVLARELVPLAVFRPSRSGQCYWAMIEGQVDEERTTTWLQLWDNRVLAMGLEGESPRAVTTFWKREDGILEGRWGWLKLLLFPPGRDGLRRLYLCIKEP